MDQRTICIFHCVFCCPSHQFLIEFNCFELILSERMIFTRAIRHCPNFTHQFFKLKVFSAFFCFSKVSHFLLRSFFCIFPWKKKLHGENFRKFNKKTTRISVCTRDFVIQHKWIESHFLPFFSAYFTVERLICYTITQTEWRQTYLL